MVSFQLWSSHFEPTEISGTEVRPMTCACAQVEAPEVSTEPTLRLGASCGSRGPRWNWYELIWSDLFFRFCYIFESVWFPVCFPFFCGIFRPASLASTFFWLSLAGFDSWRCVGSSLNLSRWYRLCTSNGWALRLSPIPSLRLKSSFRGAGS